VEKPADAPKFGSTWHITALVALRNILFSRLLCCWSGVGDLEKKKKLAAAASNASKSS